MGALLGGVLLVLITVIGFIFDKRLRKNPNKRYVVQLCNIVSSLYIICQFLECCNYKFLDEERITKFFFADNNTNGEATKIERNVINDSRGNKTRYG